MKTRSLLIVSMAALPIAGLLGCAQLTPDFDHQRESAEQVSRVDRHSSFPALRRVYFEQANLIEIIDPRGGAAIEYEKAWTDAADTDAERKWGIRYDLVLNWFRDTVSVGAEAKVMHRDSVQDKLLAISTSRCNVFKTYLRRQQSDVNFGLGMATTAAGVLGAVLPGVQASKNLAGVAGFLSGTQAEFNSAYYSNLAAQVIVQGVELRQGKLRRELLEARQGKRLDQYSLEAAINDAIVVDGTCSTVTGLMEAADSIKEISSPGLPTAASMMVAVRAMNEIAQADKVSELAESGKLQKLLKQASPMVSPLAVTNLARATPGGDVRRALADASLAQVTIAEGLGQTTAALQKAFVDAQAKLAAADKAAAAVGSGLAEAFVAKVTQTNAALKDPLTACLSALAPSAKAYGAAEAAAALQGKDEATRIAADAELARARADALAAAERIQVLVAAHKKTAETGSKAWQSRFGDTKLELKSLTEPAFTAPPAYDKLCVAS